MATQSQFDHPLEKKLPKELEEGIPEFMDHGTVFIFDRESSANHPESPYIGVISCPRCGVIDPITDQQLRLGGTLVCSGEVCAVEFHLKGDDIVFHHLN